MRRFASVLLSATLLLPGALSGQTLAEQFGGLFTFGDCGEPLCLPVNAGVHGSHYIPGVVQGQNNLLAFLGSSIATSLGNLPVSSATSAEIFSFVNGLPVAEQGSAGPIFGERAQTLGQGRFVLGRREARLRHRRSVGRAQLRLHGRRHRAVQEVPERGPGEERLDHQALIGRRRTSPPCSRTSRTGVA